MILNLLVLQKGIPNLKFDFAHIFDIYYKCIFFKKLIEFGLNYRAFM